MAEQGVLPLSSENFIVVKVYGYSARMRFDLAINGMKTCKLPIMRDGNQWRPITRK